jgi:hypothetical protein
MTVEGDINSKNSKTLSLRKLQVEKREKVTLLWVPDHMKPQTKKQKLPSKTTSYPQKNTHYKK